jgi:hypothetical protein
MVCHHAIVAEVLLEFEFEFVYSYTLGGKEVQSSLMLRWCCQSNTTNTSVLCQGHQIKRSFSMSGRTIPSPHIKIEKIVHVITRSIIIFKIVEPLMELQAS